MEKQQQKKRSDISDKRKQTKEGAPKLESKNFSGKLGLRYREAKGKSQSGKCQLCPSFPPWPGTSYSRSETNVQLKFLLLETDCYN